MNKFRIIIIILFYHSTCHSQFTIGQIDSIITDIEQKNLMHMKIGDTIPVFDHDPNQKYLQYFIGFTEFYYSKNKLLKAIRYSSSFHCTINGECYTDTLTDGSESIYYYNEDSLICNIIKEPNSIPASFQYLYFRGNELKHFEKLNDYRSDEYRLVKSSLLSGRNVITDFYKFKNSAKLEE